MKRLLFTAYDMNIGGIERALVSLLSRIDYNKYEVTLLLERVEGPLLTELPQQVLVKEHRVSKIKFSILRKIINGLKLFKTLLFNYNKYDFSCCYATYSIPGSIISRHASRNNIIWVHSNYYYSYKKNIFSMKKFFESVRVSKFKKIVFLADEALEDFLKGYSNIKDKCVVCGNIVDEKTIYEKSREKIKEKKPKRPLFINICRHDDDSKKLGRLIRASMLLKQDGYNFEVWLAGDGPDSLKYRELINRLKIGDTVKMLGMKKNPYPYYKIADYFVLTSDYEGFPVTFIESLMFDIPIITSISISNSFINMEASILLTEKNDKSVYNSMKLVLDKKVKFDFDFCISEYNIKVMDMIEKIISNEV